MSDTNQTTVIGAGTHIKGEISFETTARILGHVDGKISSAAELQIGHGAQCTASLDAPRILIEGAVEGDVTARERIQLSSSAVVLGDLTTGSLSVAEGASFVGHCRVGPEAVKALTGQPRAEAAEGPTVTTRRNGHANGSPQETIAATFAGLEAKFAAMSKPRHAESGIA